MPNLTGQSIGRYHILEQLGEGGMATVYKAYDTRLERDVAVKVLRTDQFVPAQLQMVLQRFEREAKSLAKLSHPNIVNILDYGQYRRMPYLVMEYLPGGTLKQKLGRAIFWQEAVQTLLPVARGLAYAHQHGIIHRDVKPANILMDEIGAPILTDFGIAKLLETADGQTLTASGVGIGTPEYMAPEQGMGAKVIDARADIYSLGIVLYEMVVGRKPYIADTPMAVVLKQISDPLPRPREFLPDLPEGVEHVLLKALAKQPDDRYLDMNALISAMESLLMEVPVLPVQPLPVPAAQPVEIPKFEAPLPTVAVPRLEENKTLPRRNLSPKALMTYSGVLVIFLIAVFGLSRTQFLAVPLLPNAPAATGTSTAALAIAPASTLTLFLPSATPAPPVTLTRTPRPSATSTPPPAWVTDFAEPILADIRSREPDIQDNFGWNTTFWVPGDWCVSRVKVTNGVMKMTDCHVGWTRNYENFVAALDLRLSGDEQFNFYVRRSESFGGCQFGFQASGGVFWQCNYPDPKNQVKYLVDYYVAVKNILIIVQGSRFALYVNDRPIEMIQVDVLKHGDISYLGGSGQIDNFKLWKIK